jgi:chorismate--pyruvate lyase
MLCLAGQSPDWQTADDLPGLDSALHDWLFNEDSLTRRLTALSANGFGVTPLSEGWQRLRDDECASLDVAPGSNGWVREVYLRGQGEPWVFARSVAERDALEKADMDLESLGSRSLGELLFSDQAFSRGPLQACRYPAEWLPEANRESGLWGRRSCFRRGELSVLVAEVFLPAFWRRL